MASTNTNDQASHSSTRPDHPLYLYGHQSDHGPGLKTLMQQKTKQKLVNNQINSIRNSIKGLKKLIDNGMYMDKRQRKALSHIIAYDMDDILMGL